MSNLTEYVCIPTEILPDVLFKVTGMYGKQAEKIKELEDELYQTHMDKDWLENEYKTLKNINEELRRQLREATNDDF